MGSRGLSNLRSIGPAGRIHRYQLALACVVIALCFALGNDYYRAKAIVLKNKDLFPGKRTINYLDAVKEQNARVMFRSDLKQRFLIKPSAKKQPTMLKAMFVGGETCDAAATRISFLPFNDNGASTTTVGHVDDYDLAGSGYASACPAPTCQATSGTFTDRGFAYPGTGLGPDVAYKITFNVTANMHVTMRPTSTADMAVILYGAACTNNLTDAIVLADNGPGGAAEDLNITSIPAGTYNILVDGYGTAAPGSSGPYTLAVTCATGVTGCPQPAATTAAGVTVAGRVTTAGGRGIINAVVSITDQNGVSRRALTTARGAYRFGDVEVGNSYVVRVQSKTFSFSESTRVINLTDAIGDLDFVSDSRK